MPVTETFEPIRPLDGNWETTEAYRRLLGGFIVFYGWREWPSFSYSYFGLDA